MPGWARRLARSVRFRFSLRNIRSSVSLRTTTTSVVTASGLGGGPGGASEFGAAAAGAGGGVFATGGGAGLQAASVSDKRPTRAPDRNNLRGAGFKLWIIDYTYQLEGLAPYPVCKRPVNSFTSRGPELMIDFDAQLA